MRSPLASRLAAGLGCALVASLSAGMFAAPALAEDPVEHAPAVQPAPEPAAVQPFAVDPAPEPGAGSGSGPVRVVPMTESSPSASPSTSPSTSPSASPPPEPPAAPPAAPKAPQTAAAPKLAFLDASSDVRVAPGATGKPFTTTIGNIGEGVAAGVVVTIDVADVSDEKVVTILPSSGCTITDTRARCALGDVAPGKAVRTPAVLLRGVPGAAPDAAGEITVAVEATGNPELAQAWTVHLAVPGADLAVTEIDPLTVTPGATMSLPVEMTNFGDDTAATISVFVGTPRYATFKDRLAGCTYDDESLSMECQLKDVNLRPGESLELVNVRMAIGATAPGPLDIGEGTVFVNPMTGTKPEQRAAATTSGLRYVRKAAPPEHLPDVDDRDNQTNFVIRTTANATDHAALGAKVTGKVGAVVPVTVGQTNHGPADSAPLGVDGWGNTLVVAAPKGTEFVAAPARCVAVVAKRKYSCEPEGGLALKAKQNWAFKLKITSATVGKDGTVTVDGGALDVDKGNNAATLVVTADASGTGGGTLPNTGAKIGVALGAGAALVLLGSVMLVFGRPPSRRTPAP